MESVGGCTSCIPAPPLRSSPAGMARRESTSRSSVQNNGCLWARIPHKCHRLVHRRVSPRMALSLTIVHCRQFFGRLFGHNKCKLNSILIAELFCQYSCNIRHIEMNLLLLYHWCSCHNSHSSQIPLRVSVQPMKWQLVSCVLHRLLFILRRRGFPPAPDGAFPCI